MSITHQSNISLTFSTLSACPQGELLLTTCSWSILSDGNFLLFLSFLSSLLVSLETHYLIRSPSFISFCPVISPHHLLTNHILMGRIFTVHWLIQCALISGYSLVWDTLFRFWVHSTEGEPQQDPFPYLLWKRFNNYYHSVISIGIFDQK